MKNLYKWGDPRLHPGKLQTNTVTNISGQPWEQCLQRVYTDLEKKNIVKFLIKTPLALLASGVFLFC